MNKIDELTATCRKDEDDVSFSTADALPAWIARIKAKLRALFMVLIWFMVVVVGNNPALAAKKVQEANQRHKEMSFRSRHH
eukprot:scaffold9858_cov117-Skeletonema_marinoi.AAC.3